MTSPRHLSPIPPITVRARIRRRITRANTCTPAKFWTGLASAGLLAVAATAGAAVNLGNDWTPAVAATHTPTPERSEPVARGGPIGPVFPTDIAATVARIEAETTTPPAPPAQTTRAVPRQGAAKTTPRSSTGLSGAFTTPSGDPTTSTPADTTTTPTTTAAATTTTAPTTTEPTTDQPTPCELLPVLCDEEEPTVSEPTVTAEPTETTRSE